ncbi:MAG: Nif3-like dinuclear metal center hexameric protein [Microscillaceae bacterium]|jgi:dinuclear metal center YbgI/SA1388 family protein|nr:Nif3-like dinuclear metal center hexameric protein [Microscillaceae bacterium]
MPNIQQITQYLETLAPPIYQENYDNSGLLVGNSATEVKGVLVALDALEAVVDEAIAKGYNLVVAHHPIVFKGLKRLNGNNYIERTVLKAIQNNIALYAIHTNLDNVYRGVNFKIAEQLGLQNIKILAPKPQTLAKLVVFVPETHAESVLQALGSAGAGQIGEYKNCAFQVSGLGQFEPSDKANPFIGQAGKLEKVNEVRLEVILPIHLQGKVLAAMYASHPYEEVAYYLQNVENLNQEIGSGAIGELPEAMTEQDFLIYLKEKMRVNWVRHTEFLHKKVKKIALCGGTGSFLLSKALSQKADVFVSADFKYHEFFDADRRILIADIGHYESEQFTQHLLLDLLKKQFADLTIALTSVYTNPVNYF